MAGQILLNFIVGNIVKKTDIVLVVVAFGQVLNHLILALVIAATVHRNTKMTINILKNGGDDGESELQLKRRFKAWWAVCCDPDSWRFIIRLVVFIPIMIVIFIVALIVGPDR